jgi:hypothetical protein
MHITRTSANIAAGLRVRDALAQPLDCRALGFKLLPSAVALYFCGDLVALLTLKPRPLRMQPR